MTEKPQPTQGIILSGTDRDLPDQLPQGMSRYTNFSDMTSGNSARLQSAWDTIIGRTIVVKTLLPSLALDSRQRRRFLREARVTAQLQHPNTVPVYEIGNDPDAGLYFTMKRVSGENLLEVIKRLSQKDSETEKAFPVRRLLDIIINVGQALAYSHVRGVIHRDIKPENIWVGNFGEVIVLDWGIAKVWGYPDELDGTSQPETSPADAENTDDPETDQLRTLTANGQRLGTPLYMSPEQVRGSDFIDERTDIFSLGVVLYELLTQKEPFRGQHVEETFDFIQNWDPPAPSRQALFRDIPEELDEIVSRALAKNADERYQSMLEFIEDLEPVMDTVSRKSKG